MTKKKDEELEELFCALKKIEKIWPIWGFRCNGQPYVTNAEAIAKELKKMREDEG